MEQMITTKYLNMNLCMLIQTTKTTM